MASAGTCRGWCMSPSLFSHGLLLALPSFLRLDARWLWLGLAITSSTHGEVWLAGLGLIIVSWFVPATEKRPVADAWHPLGAATVPWPAFGRTGVAAETGRSD